MTVTLVRGPRGLVPVVATASFPLINLPNFYLSFTILVSLILVKYPDRVGLVNTVHTYGTVPYRTYVPKVPNEDNALSECHRIKAA